MPPRAKTIKKEVTPQSPAFNIEQNRVVILETKRVKCADLRVFYKNPRVGNVDLIAKSLHVNGQYKPIIVNRGTHTGRKNEVLAGNHTLLGARKDITWKEGKVEYTKEAWADIVVSFVDVDENQAARIVLVDNKAADEGTYDDVIVADLFKNLPSLTGTAYTRNEVDKVMRDANRHIEEAINTAETTGKSIADIMAEMPSIANPIPEVKSEKAKMIEERANNETQQEAAARRGASLLKAEENDDLDNVETTQAELQILLESREDTIYPVTDNYWGIPKLRDDMILQTFGEKIETWGGKDATTDDGKTNYIWMDSLTSTTGVPRDGRAILGFFTFDYKFEKWWSLPAYYTSKVISMGIDKAFVPDYSVWQNDPRALHLYNAYKGYWMGRFFQEAGMKVVPVAYHCDLESLKYMLHGIPVGSPTLAIQAQAIDEKEMADQKVPEGIQRIVDTVQPKELLIYAGNPGHNMVRDLDFESQGIKVHYAMNYSGVRRGKVYDKKDGTAALTAKQKKELRAKVTEKYGINKDIKEEAVHEDYELE